MRVSGPPRWWTTLHSIRPVMVELVLEVDELAEVQVVDDGFRVSTCRPRPAARAVSIAWHHDGPLHGSPALLELDAGGGGVVRVSSDELAGLAVGRLPAVLRGLEP